VSIGSFTGTTDGTRLTATWGELFIQAGTSILAGSADARLATSSVLKVS
jgi:hypothetical protein